MTPTPYEELGLTPDVSESEIKKAYFSLVRAYPPEKDPARFKHIRAAYEALSTPDKRLHTDMTLLLPLTVPPLAPPQVTSSACPPELWREDVVRAARALSDLGRQHFREDDKDLTW